jgi:hypothetical protein
MTVRAAETYDKGQKITLGVVCENEFMAHYHPENENVVFTRYSPSGEGQLHLNVPVDFPDVPWSSGDYSGTKACELYLVYLKQLEMPSIDGAAFFAKLKVASVTDYGGTSKMVELCNDYASGPMLLGENESRMINLKLGIDNPAASDQFTPGETGWWVVAYRADQMTQAEALALAHAGS